MKERKTLGDYLTNIKDYISNIPKGVKTAIAAGTLLSMVSAATLPQLHAEEVYSKSKEDSKKGYLAVGYQNSNMLEGISMKVRPIPLVTLQGIVGFKGLNINNPTVTIDGEEVSMPDNLEIGLSATTIGLRAFLNLKRTPNMDVYVGLGAGLLLPSADLNLQTEYDTIGLELKSKMAEIQAVAGLEYRFKELPNLAFSSEIGFGYIPIGKIKGTASGSIGEEDFEGEIVIKPNTSLMNTFLGFGIHYYF